MIDLNNVVNTYDVTSINDNFDTIESELNNRILYRNPPEGKPNEMLANMDMNGNRILNLPAPIGDNEPARKIDLIPSGLMQGLKATATQLLSGDGAQMVFTLSNPPDTEENTQIYVSGVYQQKDSYSLTGASLTFSEAPPAGTNNIEVVSLGAIALELAVSTKLTDSTGSSLIGFEQAGAGAQPRTLQDKVRERVSIDDFLSTPGVITQADYDKAKAAALGSSGVLNISNNTYSFSSLNIAAQGLTVEFGPDTTLVHTGSGVAVSVDAGTNKIFNFHMEGHPLVVGNVGTTDGVFVQSVHHSSLKFRFKDVINACRVNFAVCSSFDLVCSINEQNFLINPVNGLITDQRGMGEAVQDCEFNLVLEGITGIGVNLNNTNGCEFRGTSEGNDKGVVESATCSHNSFHGFDMENNATSDVETGGENTSFYDCLSLSTVAGNNCELITARGVKFVGGFWRTINCQATSSDTLFIGMATSDNGSLGIKGSGTYKIINCAKQNTSGDTTARYDDLLGKSGTWTPSFASSGGGAQGTVTSATGTYFRIGKLCYVQGFMSIAKGTLAAGAVSISGLPFASRGDANDYQYITMCEWDNITLGTGYSTLVMRIPPSGLLGTLIKSGSAVASGNVNVADFPATMGIRFSGVYEVQ